MSESAPLLPDRQTPRTIGILNIVFGIVLLLGCNFCMGAYTGGVIAAMPAIQSAIDIDRGEKLSRIDQLEAEAKAAGDDEIKRQNLIDEQDQIKAEIASVPDISRLSEMFTEPMSLVYLVADQALGIPLNIMLIISGVGLVRMRAWGRSLALWTFVLKIVRLIPQELYFSFVVAPLWSRSMARLAASTMQPAEAAKAESGVFAGYLATYIGMGIAVLILGVIYPAIGWWLLKKKAVRGAFELPQPPDAA